MSKEKRASSFRSRPDLQGVKTRSMSGRTCANVQKQTRSSGGQNRPHPAGSDGPCGSEADPIFRGSKQRHVALLLRCCCSEADPIFRGSKRSLPASIAHARRSEADPIFRGSKRGKLRFISTAQSSEADPIFRGSKHVAHLPSVHIDAFRSRPDLQGVKTPQRRGGTSPSFRSRPDLQGVKTAESGRIASPSSSEADPIFRGSKPASGARCATRPKVQKQTRSSGGQNTYVEIALDQGLCSEADPIFRGSKLHLLAHAPQEIRFRSRPDLQGVKTDSKIIIMTWKGMFRSRPDLQGVKTDARRASR